MPEKYNYESISEFDKSVFANAKYFTAFLYGGPFNRIKIKRKTYDEIVKAATDLAAVADRPVMLYAVSKRHTCHICNISK